MKRLLFTFVLALLLSVVATAPASAHHRCGHKGLNCEPPPPPPPAACEDGLDNDLDALVDYPADPGCLTSSDTDEGDPLPSPEGRTYCGTAPVGTPPLSDADAAAKALLYPTERIPANATANQRTPTADELAAFHAAADNGWGDGPYNPSVTGNHTGTTDELISWAACKWGIDEDTIRAVAVQESDWRQSTLGDYHDCIADYQSRGITQIKGAYPACPHGWAGTVPLNELSTPFNLDYYASRIRWCYDGNINWWSYPAGDLWGCVGWWFSGGWRDAGAEDYIAKVEGHLANRAWEAY